MILVARPMTDPTALDPGAFTDASAMTLLLSTESLLFAGFSLARSYAKTESQDRTWLVKPRPLAWCMVAALAVVATGAACAWATVFQGDFPRTLPDRIMALAIIFAIIVQPLLSFLLAFGTKAKK
jgi:heme/copper-type cytochrome/quinol oxidase subunit 3